MTWRRRRIELAENALYFLFAHFEMLSNEISCPKKLHEVEESSLGVAISNFAIQIDSASRCVNEKYANTPNTARSKILETNDLTNLSTISSPITLKAIVPRPRFLALSESRLNKSIHLVWQEYV
jgi:hypothetical protein